MKKSWILIWNGVGFCSDLDVRNDCNNAELERLASESLSYNNQYYIIEVVQTACSFLLPTVLHDRRYLKRISYVVSRRSVSSYDVSLLKLLTAFAISSRVQKDLMRES